MRRASIALLAATLLTVALVAPASAGNDKGKGAANGAFRSTGTGLYVTGAGRAAQAAPIVIPGAEKRAGVAIFGYEGGPSQGRVYCGDVWNVIVTAGFTTPEDKEVFDHLSATHYLNGTLVGANDRTAIRTNHGFLDGRGLIRAYGTFVAPGTLNDGFNEVKQVLFYDAFPVWDPPPLTFEVSDSAC